MWSTDVKAVDKVHISQLSTIHLSIQAPGGNLDLQLIANTDDGVCV